LIIKVYSEILNGLLDNTSKGLAKFQTPPDKESGDSLMEAAALTKIHRPDDFSFVTRTVL
jgi:hypothetical protein